MDPGKGFIDPEDVLELAKEAEQGGPLTITERAQATYQAGLQPFSFDVHVKLGMEVGHSQAPECCHSAQYVFRGVNRAGERGIAFKGCQPRWGAAGLGTDRSGVLYPPPYWGCSAYMSVIRQLHLHTRTHFHVAVNGVAVFPCTVCSFAFIHRHLSQLLALRRQEALMQLDAEAFGVSEQIAHQPVAHKPQQGCWIRKGCACAAVSTTRPHCRKSE